MDFITAEATEVLERLTNKIIVIEEFTKSKEDYQNAIEGFYDDIKQGFEHREFRTYPVHFRFFDKAEATIHTLQLRHFLTNLMIWEPLVRFGKFHLIDESFIVDCTQLSTHLIKDYMDSKYLIPFRSEVKNKKKNKVLHDTMFNLAKISKDFNPILGLSMNVETYMDLARRNPRFNEIIRTKLDENMQPKEIEDRLNELTREQIEILKTDQGGTGGIFPDGMPNMLKSILLSGTGIKEKQHAEFAISGGLKPDLDGDTIPIPINSNFIVGGLSNITNYYIDALGGRKSVIMNKTVMGKSGHFSRMMMLVCSDIELDSSMEECASIRPIEYEIKSKEHLYRLKGRFYRTHNSREYKVLQGNEKHFIKQKLLFKSPCTCASKVEGEEYKYKVCRTCYGELSLTNYDIRSIGGFAAARITEPLSQMILSSKHLLTTQSEKVEFNPEFYNVFSISSNEIVLNNLNDEVDINNYSIVIIKDNLQMIDEFDESEFNSYLTIFHLKNKKTGEMHEIRELSEKDLYLAPEFKELVDKDKSSREYYEVDLSKANDDDRIFVVEISNNELTKPLHKIMHLLNRSDHVGCTTIDEMAQTLLDLMIESKIQADAIHGELLIRPLIRSTKDILDVPNFTKYSTSNDYQILTVEGALQRHPSVLVSLSFQDLGRQLQNPLTFRKRATSFIDPFFKERP